MQNEPLQNTKGGRKFGWIVALLLLLLSMSGLVWYINSRVQLTEAPVETPQHLTYENGQLSLSEDGPPIDLKVLISDEVAKQLKTALAVTPSPTSTATITPAPSVVDTDTDQQKLSLAGSVLSISGGNSVTLPNSSTTEVDGVVGNEVLGAAVNGGLLRTGGGTSSDPYELALQSCANGEILKNSSDSWVCSSDAGGTSYTAGDGLQLSGGAFSINSPTCAGTTKLQWTGTAFICSADVDTDTNTTYTAGNGLQLSGTQFLVNSPTCAGTTKLQWNGTAFICSADIDTDTNTTYTAGDGMQLTGTQFSVDSPTCSGTDKLQWNGTAFICSADVDTNTTNTSGNGLQLIGTQFSVDSPTCSGTDKLQWNGTAFVCAADQTGGGTCSVSGTFVCNAGNTLGAALTIGTTDAQALNFITSNTTVASFSSTGAATFQNSTNSTTAFRVLSTSGSGSLPFLVVDTTNSRAYVGNPTADSTGAILVLDTKNSAGDPDATGVDGAMYYNTVAKKARCFDDSYWVDCRPSVRSSYFYTDDFLGNATGNTVGPVLKSTVTGTSASNTNIATGITGRPGILVHDTGSTATGRAAMMTGGTEALLLGNSEPWRYETGVMLPILSDGTERFAYRAGFIDSNNSESNDGCFMKYADDVNAGEWQGVCRNNGTESTCDTNIAVVATTWYKLEVIVNAAGSSVDFKTDGTSRCQVTTNIPTGAGRSTGFGSLLFKSVGTTGRSINVDYMEVNGQLSATR